MADIAVERAGRLADGWHIPRAYRNNPQALGDELAKFHDAAKAAGRDPASLGVSSNLHAVGLEIDEQLELAEQSREAGITHLHFNTLEAGYTSPGEQIQAIRNFAEQFSLHK